MSKRPQTLYGIADSPAGLAAWMLDHDKDSYELIAAAFAGHPGGLSREDILENMLAVLADEHRVSSGRLYWENKGCVLRARGITIPVAVSAFPYELYQCPRSWAEKRVPASSSSTRSTTSAGISPPGSSRNSLRKIFAPRLGRCVKRNVKASVVSAYGGPEVMKYQDMPDPNTGRGRRARQGGRHRHQPGRHARAQRQVKDWQLHFPAIIGLDVSGTVVATGEGVTDLKAGDRVCGVVVPHVCGARRRQSDSLRQGAGDDGPGRCGGIPLVGLTGSQLISVASGLQSRPDGTGLRRGGGRRPMLPSTWRRHRART